MSYGYPLLSPMVMVEGVQLADLMDIGLRKLDAIAGRGAGKDFYDLYFIAQVRNFFKQEARRIGRQWFEEG